MKGLKSYMLAGILFVSVLGTLLHFAYQWSGDSVLVGLFTPINESIWEHTKLLFFPMLLFSLYLSKKVGHKYPCINSAMISGSLLGILLIIVLFYTYSGILGFHVAFLDISIFYVSVIIAFFLAYKLAMSCKADTFRVYLQILQFVVIGMFLLFTFYPPNLPLFIAP